MNFFYKVNTDS